MIDPYARAVGVADATLEGAAHEYQNKISETDPEMATLAERVSSQEKRKPNSLRERLIVFGPIGGALVAFTETGIFYIILGILFLGFSFWTHADSHSSFTFILVVLGVALILFGSGTQGSGIFTSNQNDAPKIKAWMAGGAGVIALVLGVGLLTLHKQVRQTFAAEKKYLVVPINLFDGTGTPLPLTDIVAEVFHLGRPVPVVKRNHRFHAHIETSNIADDEDMVLGLRIYYTGNKVESYRRVVVVENPPHKIDRQSLAKRSFEAGFGFQFLKEDERILVGIRRIQNNPKMDAQDHVKSLALSLDSNTLSPDDLAEIVEQTLNSIESEDVGNSNEFQ